jgi:exodeoxyribonuclease VII large subunit
MQNKALSLFDLLNQVKLALKNALPFSWWVMAEISELKVNYSGHCYLELIEKEDTDDSIRAKVRATIWASVFRMLQPYFETTTHTKLAAGIKVLVKVNAEFHELYGFSLNITDIEPSYTVGELVRQKQEIISRLKAEGVFNMNKELPFPELPCRIAVISSKTAAGYGDFMDQLTQNPFGYKFYVRLFSAVMQGEEAEQSIIHSLDRIFTYEDFFDLVVIIRGGGAQSELNCFNSYLLTSHVCQFPLPVLTGIGHEQDETITDLVAHTRLKTPTAVAEFLIDLFRQADEKINDLSVSLFEIVSSKVKEETGMLDRYSLLLKPAAKKQLLSFKTNLRILGTNLNGDVKRFLLKESGVMNRRSDRVKNLTMEYLHNRQHTIDMLFRKNTYLDPFLILSRGYSVTYYKGKALKSPSLVADNEIIETRLAEGIMKSKKLIK